MQILFERHGRRGALRQIGGWAAGLSAAPLLSACGGGEAPAADALPPVAPPTPAPAPPPVGATSMTAAERQLNLALNIAYLGAQYHGLAAGGGGLPVALTTGIGQPGSVIGGRPVAFADPAIATLATNLAADKLDHVAALRRQLGASAAAMPSLDLSAVQGGAFSRIARAAGLVADAPFDPFAGDEDFLAGAFMIENGVAAVHRHLLAGATDAAVAPLNDNLSRAVFHGALVRTLMDRQTQGDPARADRLTALCAALAGFDGTDAGDQSIVDDASGSANIIDGAGRPIPYSRTTEQALRTLVLGPGARGGFLPDGANGLA